MIRLVLFDIDGTLIRTGGAGVKAFERGFDMVFGVPNATRRMQFAGRTDRSLVSEFCRNHGLAPTSEILDRFFTHYTFLLDQFMQANKGEVCPAVSQFINELQSHPLNPALGLLTGNILLGAEIKLRHHGLWELFQTGAFGDDHESRNELASIAARRGSQFLERELKGDEILVIGDTPLDVECGKSIGARTLAVATGAHKRSELLHHSPDIAVNDLREISIEKLLS